MSDLWNDIEAAANAINNACDEIFKELLEVEDKLISLKTGFHFFSEDEFTDGLYLGFTRIHKKWCLVVRSDKETYRLRNAKRHVRIEASHQMESFLTDFSKGLKNATDEIKEARK